MHATARAGGLRAAAREKPDPGVRLGNSLLRDLVESLSSLNPVLLPCLYLLHLPVRVRQKERHLGK